MRLVNQLLISYDRIIIPISDLLVDRDTISRRLNTEFRLNFDDGKKGSEFEYYSKLVSIVHDRVSTLVGHLSIMIAVSMFALDKVDGQIGKTLLSLEVLFYIILTVFTIRALKSSGLQIDHADSESYMEELKGELSTKYAIAQSSLALTILLTILLCVFSIIGYLT